MAKTKYQIIFNADHHLNKLLRAIEDPRAFAGRTARTDRNVMRALVILALGQGAYTIHPGTRKIAEISGHCRRTVEAALWRLRKRNWIEDTWSAPPMDGRASRIRLCWERANDFLTAELADPLLKDISLWNGDCLGGNARAVYQHLIQSDVPLKKTPLQESTNLGYKALTSALSVLLGENLVIKNGRTYSAVRYLDAVEARNLRKKILERFGVDAKIQKRQLTHQAERDIRNHLLKHNGAFRQAREQQLFERRVQRQRAKKLGVNAADKTSPSFTSVTGPSFN